MRRALRRHQVRQDAVQRGSAASRPSAVRRQPNAEYGWVSADTPVPYRIADVVHIIDEWLGKLDQRYPRADLRALKHRLEALSHDPRFRFMFGKLVVEDNMAKVVSRIFRMPKAGAPVTIVQLAGLPNEVVNSVVSVLARMAFEIALWSEATYEIALLCEEAHRYIPADRRKASCRPARRSAASPRRDANTAPRSASSRSVPPSSTRRCSRNARRCSRCAWPTSTTRRS